jgi:hypothetical protein
MAYITAHIVTGWTERSIVENIPLQGYRGHHPSTEWLAFT